MANDRQRLIELREINRLQELRAKAAGTTSRAPSVEQPWKEKEPGLVSGSFSPTNMLKNAAEALGIDTNAMGRNAVNTATLGYAPQIAGAAEAMQGGEYLHGRDKAVNQLKEDMKVSPKSSVAGMVGGGMTMGGAASNLVKAAPTVAGRIGMGTALGGAQGAIANPGDVVGEIAPVQPVERAKGGALGAFLGGALSAGGELVKKGAQAAKDIRLVKSGGASDVVKQEIDSALKSIDENQLAPRDQKLRELVQGKKFEINPDRVEPTFPRLAGSMRKNISTQQVPTPNDLIPGSQAVPISPRVSIDGERALRLKRAADSAAGYGSSKPFDPVATAKGEEAKSLADLLRSQINQVPGAQQVNSEMAEIMAKTAALKNSARGAPISAIRAQPGTDKDSLVKTIDKLAGSNLEGLDSRIGTAKDLLLHPSNFVKPLEAMNELRKTGVRSATELSRALEKATQGTKEALLQQALEAKRRAK